MKREGVILNKLPAGDRRRVSDARNAWMKASAEQRLEIMIFMVMEGHPGGTDTHSINVRHALQGLREALAS